MQKNMTKPTKQKDVQRSWHLINLHGQTLGRVSVQMAELLMGKGKPYFVRNLDCGDFIIAINAKDVEVSGKKETQKIYYRYSGYPGGLKRKTLSDLRTTKPEEIIYHAVKGMLPQNRLRDRMLKRLFVFPKEQHPYANKIK